MSQEQEKRNKFIPESADRVGEGIEKKIRGAKWQEWQLVRIRELIQNGHFGPLFTLLDKYGLGLSKRERAHWQKNLPKEVVAGWFAEDKICQSIRKKIRTAKKENDSRHWKEIHRIQQALERGKAKESIVADLEQLVGLSEAETDYLVKASSSEVLALFGEVKKAQSRPAA